MTGCALGFFLQIYLLDVAQVSGMSLPGLLQHPEVGQTRDCLICEMGMESLLCCLSELAVDGEIRRLWKVSSRGIYPLQESQLARSGNFSLPGKSNRTWRGR